MENQNQFLVLSHKLLCEFKGKYLVVMVLQDIIYRCNLNEKKQNSESFYDGIYWSKLSYKQLQHNLRMERLKTERQISLALKLLYKKGFIRKRKPFASCNWYAPTEKVRELLGDEYYMLANPQEFDIL